MHIQTPIQSQPDHSRIVLLRVLFLVVCPYHDIHYLWIRQLYWRRKQSKYESHQANKFLSRLILKSSWLYDSIPIQTTIIYTGLHSWFPPTILYSNTDGYVCSCLLQSFDRYKQEFNQNQFFIYIHPLIHSCGQYLSVCLREITEEVEDKENGVIDNMMEWHSHYDH